MTVKRALISVSDKKGIVEFAKELHAASVEIISTGGTSKLLAENGVPVIPISEVTQFPEMMDGRVKTLHPAIHGGILALRSNPEHLRQINEQAITPIDLVVVNLYPFKQTIEKPGVTLDEAIENIDIGGPTMLRSAAKNHRDVAVVVKPERYDDVIAEIQKTGDISAETKKALAVEAFEHTAQYDSYIYNYLWKQYHPDDAFPNVLSIAMDKKMTMRYGENPHQRAAFYTREGAEPSVPQAKQLHGKELSYNNILDLDCAFEVVKEFTEPTVAIIKHAVPSGVASAADIADAYKRAYECDTESPYGGVVAANRPITAAMATQMAKLFLEVVIAPSYDKEALEILTKKKNLRLLEVGALTGVRDDGMQVRSVVNGILVQDRDIKELDPATLTVATKRAPTDEEMRALLFGWKVARHIRSNSLVFAKDGYTTGIGGGQTARVHASKIACIKGGDAIKGSILASEAFFPFRDSVDVAAEAGVTAIIQPGGSIRDEEVIAAANEHDMAMVFTGMRVFKH